MKAFVTCYFQFGLVGSVMSRELAKQHVATRKEIKKLEKKTNLDQ